MATDTLQIIPEMQIIYYAVAFLCGCVAATAELFSRYSDGPVRTFQCKESYFYLILNGSVSLIAYAIILQSEISFLQWGKSPLLQSIFAGFSAMVILRSSVASIKHGQTTFQVGFAPVIQAFLDTADRAFDRNRSHSELTKIREIMRDVDFNKAAKDLPTTCLNLMQNVSKEESERVGEEVAGLVNNECGSQAKSVNLGITISRVTGPELLRLAVETLGDTIRLTPKQTGAPDQQHTLTSQEAKIKALKEKFLG